MPDWPRFYAATEGRPPRPTLRRALDLLEAEGSPGFAVDLGCGAGRDSVELLRRGWRVLAIDGEAEALRRLEARADLPSGALREARLETRQARFDAPDFTLPRCELVNASFSIPFCAPADFRRLWAEIWRALRPGGCFAGQLLGQRDSWAARDGVTAVDDAGLAKLTAGTQILLHEEEEQADSITVTGKAKHWHIHHLVLRKPRGAPA